MTKPAKWLLAIRPELDKGDDDANRRLRAALKYMLRVFGLRCISISEPDKANDKEVTL